MQTAAGEEVLDADPTSRPAWWWQPLPFGRRVAALTWRVGIGLGLSGWLGSAQLANNIRGPEWLWTFGILAFSIFMGVRAFRRRAVRVYETTVVRYSMRQRLRRSARWLLAGIALLAVVWGMQLSQDHFREYWWYAWPCLFPILVGVGLYLLNQERVLSGPAQWARAQEQAAKEQARQATNARAEAVLESGPVRYMVAALCFYGAYYFAFEDSGKHNGWAVLSAIVVGCVFARELGLWLLGLALLVGVGWALFAGIAALPVSAAIVIGALIIASAIRKN